MSSSRERIRRCIIVRIELMMANKGKVMRMPHSRMR
jgi:hypothetical protein